MAHFFSGPNQLKPEETAKILRFVKENRIQQVVVADTFPTSEIVKLCVQLARDTTAKVIFLDHHAENPHSYEQKMAAIKQAFSASPERFVAKVSNRASAPACALLVPPRGDPLKRTALVLAGPPDVDAFVTAALIRDGNPPRSSTTARDLGIINQALGLATGKQLWHPIQLAAVLSDSPSCKNALIGDTQEVRDLVRENTAKAFIGETARFLMTAFPNLQNRIFTLWMIGIERGFQLDQLIERDQQITTYVTAFKEVLKDFKVQLNSPKAEANHLVIDLENFYKRHFVGPESTIGKLGGRLTSATFYHTFAKTAMRELAEAEHISRNAFTLVRTVHEDAHTHETTVAYMVPRQQNWGHASRLFDRIAADSHFTRAHANGLMFRAEQLPNVEHYFEAPLSAVPLKRP